MPPLSESYASSDSPDEDFQDEYAEAAESEEDGMADDDEEDEDDGDVDAQDNSFLAPGSAGGGAAAAAAAAADAPIAESAGKKSRMRLNVAEKAVAIQAGTVHGCAIKNGQALLEKVEKVIIPYLTDHYAHLTLDKKELLSTSTTCLFQGMATGRGC